MLRDSRSAIPGQMRSLFDLGTLTTLSDGQLLERFATDRGEGSELAFAALVERHGPMVYRVCRGVLQLPEDAQDAFQATFFILIKKARGLWVRDSLGPWLHQVAFRTSLCSRSARRRRTRHEQRAAFQEEPFTFTTDSQLPRDLHDAINRLPRNYQAPLVLCELEGQSHEQAARALGVPLGTVKSRLARGREQLRRRLERLGYSPNISMLAAALRGGQEFVLPEGLVATTTTNALRFMAQSFAGGTTLWLTQGILQSMFLFKVMQATLICAGIGAAALGVSLIATNRVHELHPPAAGGSQSKNQDAAKDDDDQNTIKVKPGRLDISITERGTLKGTGSSAYSEIEGQTTILLLMPEGKRVKKGDLVAELDSSSLRDNLTNQEITLTRAGADHAKAQKTRQIAELSIQEYLDGSFKQRQAELEAEIFIAKARQNRLLEGIKRTRVALDRLKSISENKPETDSASILATLDLEERIAESELEIERAKLDTEQAGRKLDLFLKTTHTKTIAQLEVGLEQAKSDELAKRASYELERTKFEKLRRQIVKCKLLAWEDGMIVYANDAKQPGQPMIEEGATVRERQAIFSIFNPGRMQVVAKVREAWVDRLVPDQKVSIHVDAVPNERLEGRVRTISPVPDSATGGIKFHTTIIDIDAPPRMLRPGMTAESNILIDRLDDVIAVPLSAVKQVGNSHYVLIKRDDGKFEWRSVQPGRASSTEVEIKQGLSAGEHVVRDFDALTQSEQLRVGPFPYQR